MVNKQTLLTYDLSNIDEYFEMIYDNIDTDVDESRVMFNKLSVPQKASFFRYISDNYFNHDDMSYPIRDLKSILLDDDE